MTKVKKNLIIRYAISAEELFYKCSEVCEKIEDLLEEDSKVEILEVLYQPGDRLVVAVDSSLQKFGSAPDNIPIKEFLERYVK